MRRRLRCWVLLSSMRMRGRRHRRRDMISAPAVAHPVGFLLAAFISGGGAQTSGWCLRVMKNARLAGRTESERRVWHQSFCPPAGLCMGPPGVGTTRTKKQERETQRRSQDHHLNVTEKEGATVLHSKAAIRAQRIPAALTGALPGSREAGSEIRISYDGRDVR